MQPDRRMKYPDRFRLPEKVRMFRQTPKGYSEEWRDDIESETRVSGLLKGSQKELGAVSDAGSGDRIFHYI